MKDDLFARGFSTAVADHDGVTLASLVSLGLGIQAWFSTYRAVSPWPHMLVEEGHCQPSAGGAYKKAYCETVLFTHHFLELAVKDVLRAEHPLLANSFNESPVELHQFLSGELLEPSKSKSVEFSLALRRAVKLSSDNRLGRAEEKGFAIALLPAAQSWMEKLNDLRNRVWHRGSYVLPYLALDRVMLTHVVPFLVSWLEAPIYLGLDKHWKYGRLPNEVDPLSELLTLIAYDLVKVGYLKELGRAAYRTPFQERAWLSSLDDGPKADYEVLARAVAERIWNGKDPKAIAQCPACATQTLVPVPGQASEIGQYRCVSCSFTVAPSMVRPRLRIQESNVFDA